MEGINLRQRLKGENKIVDVVIQKIVPGGYGLAFAEKTTVFVALAAPGDEARVRIKRRKGNVAFAEIVEITKPSTVRQTPPCPYFGICGGCDFQQMNYSAQLSAKAAVVRDCLERIGKIDYQKEIPVVASPDDLNYRTRAQWHIDSRNKKIGYFQRESHRIVDVEACPILAPALQTTLERLRRELNFEEFWAETAEIETAAGDDGVSVYSAELIEPTEEVFFDAAGNRYFHDAESFFQGNRFLVEDLIRLATKDAEGETALDLYCGVGLFSLPLARRFGKVFGVEANPKTVGFAAKNAENARLANVRFAAAAVSAWLAENAEKLKNIDFLLLDPPRAGAEKETIESLLKIRPREISYVSCDPATLARDLRLLTTDLYSLESITALDLFPQTHHVETVVRLRLKM